MAAQAPSPWRSWPVAVIALSVVAIGGALLLMFWPGCNAPPNDPGKHALQPPPAPEHMETDKLPTAPQPQGGRSSDPWSPPHSQADPRPTPDPLPADPADPADPDDPTSDPFGGIAGGGSGGSFGGTFGGGGASFLYTALDHACRRLKTCPDVDQSMLSMTCDVMSSMPKQPVPGCAAAQRCLDAIDHMACSQTGFANPTSVITMFQDCTTATTRC